MQMKTKILFLTIAIAIASFVAYSDANVFRGLGSIAGEVASAAVKKSNNKLRSAPIIDVNLLIADEFGISSINVNTSIRRSVTRTSFVNGLDYHLERNRMYWSDISTGTIYARPLYANDFSMYNAKRIIEHSPLKWRPQAIAVDYVADKIYVLDSRSKKVHAFDLDGRHESVVFDKSLADPMDIAIDPNEGVMFIADETRIIRVNMDGSSPTGIVSYYKYFIKSVSLDLKNKRVYWSDETFHRIKSANYDGTGFEIVLKNEPDKPYSLLGPANLAFHDGLLYFYDDMWRRIASVKVDEETGSADESSYRVVYGIVNVRSMKVIHPEQRSTADNPCAIGNGNCSRQCLLAAKDKSTGKLTRTCA